MRILGALLSAAIGPLCFLKIIGAAIHQDFLKLNPAENLRIVVKKKIIDTKPNNAGDLKVVIKVTEAYITNSIS